MRQGLVHDCNEPVVMMPLQQMHHFVGNDVFQAGHRLLGELKVQPDAAGLDIVNAVLKVK